MTGVCLDRSWLGLLLTLQIYTNMSEGVPRCLLLLELSKIDYGKLRWISKDCVEGNQ